MTIPVTNHDIYYDADQRDVTEIRRVDHMVPGSAPDQSAALTPGRRVRHSRNVRLEWKIKEEARIMRIHDSVFEFSKDGSVLLTVAA